MGFDAKTKLANFVKQAGWPDADIVAMAQDASSRQYFRVSSGSNKAILMLAPLVTKENVSPYARTAKLAQNDCGAFICLARELAERGFSSPQILAIDLPSGLVLLEDLGEDLFASVIDKHPHLEADLYKSAVHTLAALTRSTFGQHARYEQEKWPISPYDQTALLAETDLFTQWYLPGLDIRPTPELIQQLEQAWGQVLRKVSVDHSVLVLRDFHAQNLIWLPERGTLANVGLLDFQDAVFGSPAYDLVSLLQDARRDVDATLEKFLIEDFINQAKITDRPAFLSAYRVLGAQRAAKILGIFVRLAKRDNKPRYLSLLPRVEAQFTNNLIHPDLAPVREILRPVLPDLIPGVGS